MNTCGSEDVDQHKMNEERSFIHLHIYYKYYKFIFTIEDNLGTYNVSVLFQNRQCFFLFNFSLFQISLLV